MAGADYSGSHADKISLVTSLLQRNGINHPADVIIIGDTSYDIDAASELEIESIGVAMDSVPLKKSRTSIPTTLHGM